MARFVVAVTGGIASGKSLVDRAFSDLGVPVVDADRVAREVVEPGTPALVEIAAAFGQTMLRSDGSLDRTAMRALVFSDEVARHKLEAITHPKIRSIMMERCSGAPEPYVIASIPLLSEAGAVEAYHWLRRVLVVDTSVGEQRRRLIARDGVDRELADRIIASQGGRERRLRIASDVIVNDAGIGLVRRAVGELHLMYRRLAAG